MVRHCLDKRAICGGFTTDQSYCIVDAFNDLDFVARSAYPKYPSDGHFGDGSTSAIFDFKNKMTGIVQLTVNQGGLQRCNMDSLHKKAFKKALSTIADYNQAINNRFTGQLSLEYAQGILQKAVFIEKNRH